MCHHCSAPQPDLPNHRGMTLLNRPGDGSAAARNEIATDQSTHVKSDRRPDGSSLPTFRADGSRDTCTVARPSFATNRRSLQSYEQPECHSKFDVTVNGVAAWRYQEVPAEPQHLPLRDHNLWGNLAATTPRLRSA